MFPKIRRRKTFKKNKKNLDPEQAFIDAKNLPDFDTNKFEGVLEKPLNLISFYIVIGLSFLIFLIFIFFSLNLQVLQSDIYQKKSANNHLKKAVLFSNRGVIFDRNNIPLAWNENDGKMEFSIRKYINLPGFSHILGFLSYPQKDKFNKYFEKEYQGKAGIEKYFNKKLNGELGYRLINMNVHGKIISENIEKNPKAGSNLTLTIDSKMQEKLQQALNDYIQEKRFKGGAGIIINIKNGEILAMTSLPEYDSNILTAGKNKEKISEYNKNKNHPFLNRAVYGEFVPGSVMKPFVALAGLQEKIITPYQKIYTNGKMYLPNPWNPKKPSIFYDWKNHGTIDLFSAIANSSNIYFYKVGGGYKKMKGLGIDRIYKYLTTFGFGKKTNIEGFPELLGNIPNKNWKEKIFKQPWSIGNTYFTAIGQYGTLVTPIQLATAVSLIANDGTIIKPKIILNKNKSPKENTRKLKIIDKKNYAILRKAMRATVTRGTTQSLNLPFVKIASKSGTAQIKGKTRENSWVVGFWPYKNPKYAFVFLAENGPKTTRTGVSRAASEFFKKINNTNSLKKYLK